MMKKQIKMLKEAAVGAGSRGTAEENSAAAVRSSQLQLSVDMLSQILTAIQSANQQGNQLEPQQSNGNSQQMSSNFNNFKIPKRKLDNQGENDSSHEVKNRKIEDRKSSNRGESSNKGESSKGSDKGSRNKDSGSKKDKNKDSGNNKDKNNGFGKGGKN